MCRLDLKYFAMKLLISSLCGNPSYFTFFILALQMALRSLVQLIKIMVISIVFPCSQKHPRRFLAQRVPVIVITSNYTCGTKFY